MPISGSVVVVYKLSSTGHENMLHLSWHDSGWIPSLNSSNVLDYFSERSNPFYDRQCNNEIIKMQRLSSEQLRLVGMRFFGLLFVCLFHQLTVLIK